MMSLPRNEHRLNQSRGSGAHPSYKKLRGAAPTFFHAIAIKLSISVDYMEILPATAAKRPSTPSEVSAWS